MSFGKDRQILSDDSAAIIGERYPSLADLSLRGCTLVGNSGVLAVVAGCRRLRALDLRGCYRITNEVAIAIGEHLADTLESLSRAKSLSALSLDQ